MGSERFATIIHSIRIVEREHDRENTTPRFLVGLPVKGT